MNFQNLNLFIHQSKADAIESYLLDSGALAISFQSSKQQDEIFEPPIGETVLWDNLILTALFDESISLKTLLEQMTSQHPEWGECLYQTESLKTHDWQEAWKAFYRPLAVTKDFWVVPSWMEEPKNARILTLDPGLAFGTGNHETTQLCLKWLANHSPNGNFLDLGCGSGILAIAAALLGAKTIWAIDIDPQAITATTNNFSLNQAKIPNHIEFFTGLNEKLPENFQTDILMANILFEPLKGLSGWIQSRLKPKAQLVLSGLLIHQAHDLKNHYPFIDWTRFETQGDWALIAGQAH
jgi:ribosomal protein L11 methyltransferase